MKKTTVWAAGACLVATMLAGTGAAQAEPSPYQEVFIALEGDPTLVAEPASVDGQDAVVLATRTADKRQRWTQQYGYTEGPNGEEVRFEQYINVETGLCLNAPQMERGRMTTAPCYTDMKHQTFVPDQFTDEKGTHTLLRVDNFCVEAPWRGPLITDFCKYNDRQRWSVTPADA
ncbi:hypothetical protein ABZ135_23115 [Streptomyces sp. NPDC006339]|uniref:hypothetical protein n=1 Tax=Streptomyces sp. NPDC006339 TaxID=3156755 RepID=UPI0033AAB8DA